MEQNTSILDIKGIGEKSAKLFHKIGISTVGDLLYHFPRDYEVFGEIVSIKDAPVGQIVSVYATVMTAPTMKKIRNLTISNLFVKDQTAGIQLTYFNMPYLNKVLKVGNNYVFRGILQSKGISLVMEQPKIYSYTEYHQLMGVLQPKYSLTKGLTNQAVQKAVKQALSFYKEPTEYLSEHILEQYHLINRKDALADVHYPMDKEALAIGRKRLVFDEFFAFLFMLRKNKDHTTEMPNQYPMIETADTVRFIEGLPFQLTKGQRKVWQEIRDDCEGNFTMNRLIQGDVGSGKTIVAVLALLMCAANGYQGAMMAPTEVLAVQHYETIKEYTEKYHLAFRPILLVGSMTAKEKREAYAKIEQNEVNLIIGTHALIQDKVKYHSLGLVVTDEQHRFGVRQRELLAYKGGTPHILVMSATPIPRTLAIILYGDLNISIIDELPADRLPIKNCVVNTSYRNKAYDFIAKQVAEGHQVYVICPQIEPGEMEDAENVIEYSAKLKQELPAQIQVAYLHGKMKPAQKNDIMESFAAGNIDVLVSTTVIEVGINVPNATVMMVENAERFGLAQLHQLRGRVGRGAYQSYCIFISTNEKKETMERLEILNKSNDGFYIASEDLKLRGPGELMGIRQSGEFAFELGDIYADANVLKEAKDAVDELFLTPHFQESESYQEMVRYFDNQARNLVDFRTI